MRRHILVAVLALMVAVALRADVPKGSGNLGLGTRSKGVQVQNNASETKDEATAQESVVDNTGSTGEVTQAASPINSGVTDKTNSNYFKVTLGNGDIIVGKIIFGKKKKIQIVDEEGNTKTIKASQIYLIQDENGNEVSLKSVIRKVNSEKTQEDSDSDQSSHKYASRPIQVLESALLPGLGQMRRGQKAKGVLILGSFVVSALGTVDYDRAGDEDYSIWQRNPTDQNKQTTMNDDQLLTICSGVAIGIYALNIVDVIFWGPKEDSYALINEQPLVPMVALTRSSTKVKMISLAWKI